MAEGGPVLRLRRLWETETAVCRGERELLGLRGKEMLESADREHSWRLSVTQPPPLASGPQSFVSGQRSSIGYGTQISARRVGRSRTRL